MDNRVGIVTMYRKNYGAFLQAYALEQVLLSIGLKPEIIRYDYYREKSILGIPLAKFKTQPLNFFKAVAVEIIRFRAHHARDAVFAESVKRKLIESSEYYSSYSSLAASPPEYDLYITGSDQVFNVKYSPHALGARLLSFVKSGKKASYAASAGSSTIPLEYHNCFRDAFSTFTGISVREHGLQAFLNKEYGLEVQRHVDPTLLLSQSDWSLFAGDERLVPGKYIFYYRVLPQEDIVETTKRISEQLGLPVFVADGNDEFPNQIERKGYLSPEEWVGAMRDAAYVVTNSFHGAAFAINMDKRASILLPLIGGERVKDLIDSCNLSETIAQPIMPENTSEIYYAAHTYFTLERAKSLKYLRGLL